MKCKESDEQVKNLDDYSFHLNIDMSIFITLPSTLIDSETIFFYKILVPQTLHLRNRAFQETTGKKTSVETKQVPPLSAAKDIYKIQT